MTAVVTATRVLSWAAEAPGGAPPTGPLWEARRLADPPTGVRDAATRLARRTSALLGAGSPPFGSRDQIGLGVVFLAAAVGGREQASAAALLARALAPANPHRDPSVWYDLIARHGLVSATLTALAGAVSTGGPGQSPTQDQAPEQSPELALPELLIEASPLTAVLHRPTWQALKSGATGRAVNTTVALLGRPRGQAVLADGLARWSPLPAVLTWRCELLSRLRHDHRDLVLDVYLVARTRHGALWDDRVRWAGRQLGMRGAPDPLAIATLRFWSPLAALERAAGGPLSGLRPLMTGQDRALHYVRRFRLDQAGAA